MRQYWYNPDGKRTPEEAVDQILILSVGCWVGQHLQLSEERQKEVSTRGSSRSLAI
jgi:hypothetical protein